MQRVVAGDAGVASIVRTFESGRVHDLDRPGTRLARQIAVATDTPRARQRPQHMLARFFGVVSPKVMNPEVSSARPEARGEVRDVIFSRRQVTGHASDRDSARICMVGRLFPAGVNVVHLVAPGAELRVGERAHRLARPENKGRRNQQTRKEPRQRNTPTPPLGLSGFI